MKYLLLVHFANGSESYYANDPDILKEYAELKKFNSWEVFELNKTVYSFIDCNTQPINRKNICRKS